MGYIKDAVRKTFFAKGEDVIARNIAAIDAGGSGLIRIEIPESWAFSRDEIKKAPIADRPGIITKLLEPMNAQKGDSLPVSAFVGYEDGTVELGLTAYEKRGLASMVPVWDPSLCIQCNRCSYVCPHAVIRPYLLNAEEMQGAPENIKAVPAMGAAGYSYTLQISKDDCTGCGSCVRCCPAKQKALSMTPVSEIPDTRITWEYALKTSDKEGVFDPYSVKGSQFRTPLLEFSAACAGCGETPYAKLLTQLFGDRVYWANATGCSQAWGSPMPGIPYTKNKHGRGPAWSNSLFENNAEFSLGMFLSVKQQRDAQKIRSEKLLAGGVENDLEIALRNWTAAYDDFEKSAVTGRDLTAALEKSIGKLSGNNREIACELLQNKDHFSKKTFWMYGGDGWAYDIGFGGLDHVLASGENVNVFIVDTEVYSNTGGQSSKATPLGAVAQFCISGKTAAKKDLGAIFMTYGNIYVAQVCNGSRSQPAYKGYKGSGGVQWPVSYNRVHAMLCPRHKGRNVQCPE